MGHGDCSHEYITRYSEMDVRGIRVAESSQADCAGRLAAKVRVVNRDVIKRRSAARIGDCEVASVVEQALAGWGKRRDDVNHVNRRRIGFRERLRRADGVAG